MSYVIVSDVHLHNWSPFSTATESGINSRLEIILNELERATAPLLKGERLYITGDLFHVRGHIAPSVLNPTLDLFKTLIARDIKIRIIPGNHDLESKNTNALTNAVQALEAIGCEICNEVTFFSDDKVVMIPWIDSLEELRKVMETNADYLRSKSSIGTWTMMIHAPLNDVLPIPDHGLSSEELSAFGFERVFCGHYHHHKEFDGGVYSVGALTHQTWSDVNTKAGFVVIDDKHQLTHEETKAPKFVDFGDCEDADDEQEILNLCKGNYVRVQLGEATEKEIREIREGVMKQYKTAGCIIKSVPKPVGVTRTSSVSSGASIENSISDWTKANVDASAVKEVTARCLEILKETEANE